jgi:N-carbamoyl-L-amino-acid hydrolase
MTGSRLWQRLMRLGQIGARGNGGVDRQALSPGEIEAWRLLLSWAEEARLEPSTDAAGNLFLTLPGRDRALPPALIGSHVDTQPNGGLFDGAFGVLAALEVVTDLSAQGRVPARDITVVAWMNEEGCRFAPGMMGSEAFAGLRSLEAIRAVRDTAGVSVGQALDALHAAFPALARRPLGFRPAFCIEPHIEQGPLLEQAGLPLGIVTGIQGKITWEVTLAGEEGHAGTLDMARRRDALAAFARIATRMQRAVGAADPIVKFTIGMVKVMPNAPSVVPGRVVFRIDLRHPDNAALQAHGAALEAIARAEAPPCAVTLARLVDAPSNTFDDALRARLAAAAERLGLGAMAILSAAGHDARHLAALCPTAMIFIPCRGGVSHSPEEWAEAAHVDAGAALLGEVVREMTA